MQELFGRGSELALVDSALERAAEGLPTIVLVEGRPGIGKSHLLATVADDVRRRDVTVVYARADPIERDVPLATLAAAAHEGTGAGRLDDVRSPATLAAELRERSRRRPLLIAVDDLDAADHASAATLASLLRSGCAGCHLAVVVTTSAGVVPRHPGGRSMFEGFVADGSLHPVVLGPLDRAEAAALATDAAGAPLSGELEDRLWTAARGHPGYLVEAVRSTGSTAGATGATGPTAPATVARQLDALGQEASSLARALSVTERFGAWLLPVVADVCGVDPDRAADAFDALLASGIVATSAAPDEYAFAYPIVRDTLHADLGPARARRLHTALAHRLRRRGTDHPHAIVALAPHVAASADVGDETAVAELVQAADVVAATAPALGERWYGRARELLWPTHPDHARLAAGQMRCQLAAGRFDEAAASGMAAVALLPVGPERQGAAAGVVRSLAKAGRTTKALRTADDHVACGPVTPRLLIERARALVALDRFAAAQRDADTALAMVVEDVDGPGGVHGLDGLDHGLDRVGLEIDAVGVLVAVAHSRGLPAERDELLDRQLALSHRASSRTRFAALANAAAKLAQTGSLAAAADTIEAAEAISAGAGAGGGGTLVDARLDVAKATHRFATGDWSVGDEIARVLRRSPEPGAYLRGILLALAVEIHSGRGAMQSAADLVDEVDALPSVPLLAAVATAGLHLAVGEADRAVEALAERCEVDVARGRVIGLPYALLRLVDALVAADRPDQARRWATELATLARKMPFPLLEACAARAASIVSGEACDAARAVAACARHGYVFEEARSRMELGARGVEPAAHLAAAHDTFGRLAATPWRRRAAALMRERGMTARRAAGPGRDELTGTETELVRHLRAGLTNRQIANAMSLSPKTIEAYLTRLYAKVGTATRVELIVKMAKPAAVAS